jgi:putative inorganic carbon (HCO3(-)) transporter
MSARLDRAVSESVTVGVVTDLLQRLFAYLGQGFFYRLFTALATLVGGSAILRALFDRPLGPSPFSSSRIVAALAEHFPHPFTDPERRTYWGLLFLILYVPIELYVITRLPSEVKYLSDAAVVLLLLYLLSGIFKGAWAFRATPVDLPVLALAAVGLASGFFMDVPAKVLFFGLRAYLEYYVVYLVVVAAPISDDDKKRLLWTFVTWAVVMALVGATQKFLGIATPRSWVEANEAIKTRVFGTMANPNTFAGYLMVALSLFAALLTVPQKPLYRSLLAVGLAIGGFALVFTYSREGLLALAAAMLVIGFVADRRVLVLLLGLAVLALIADPKVAERFSFGFSSTYVNVSLNYGRLYYWLKGLELFLHHPLLGVGPGRFGGSVAHIFGSPWYQIYGLGGMSTVDSEMVQVLGEMGILGFLCYLWILVTLVRQGIRVWRSDPDPFWRAVALGSAAATVGFTVQSVFASLFEVHQIVLGLWFLGGLVGWRTTVLARARGSI